ncbi:MAG: hypothetical protein ACJAR2_003090 [Ilumatobacter sp.]|jgi:hypothetical protein
MPDPGAGRIHIVMTASKRWRHTPEQIICKRLGTGQQVDEVWAPP